MNNNSDMIIKTNDNNLNIDNKSLDKNNEDNYIIKLILEEQDSELFAEFLYILDDVVFLKNVVNSQSNVQMITCSIKDKYIKSISRVGSDELKRYIKSIDNEKEVECVCQQIQVGKYEVKNEEVVNADINDMSKKVDDMINDGGLNIDKTLINDKNLINGNKKVDNLLNNNYSTGKSEKNCIVKDQNKESVNKDNLTKKNFNTENAIHEANVYKCPVSDSFVKRENIPKSETLNVEIELAEQMNRLNLTLTNFETNFSKSKESNFSKSSKEISTFKNFNTVERTTLSSDKKTGHDKLKQSNMKINEFKHSTKINDQIPKNTEEYNGEKNKHNVNHKKSGYNDTMKQSYTNNLNISHVNDNLKHYNGNSSNRSSYSSNFIKDSNSNDRKYYSNDNKHYNYDYKHHPNDNKNYTNDNHHTLKYNSNVNIEKSNSSRDLNRGNNNSEDDKNFFKRSHNGFNNENSKQDFVKASYNKNVDRKSYGHARDGIRNESRDGYGSKIEFRNGPRHDSRDHKRFEPRNGNKNDFRDNTRTNYKDNHRQDVNGLRQGYKDTMKQNGNVPKHDFKDAPRQENYLVKETSSLKDLDKDHQKQSTNNSDKKTSNKLKDRIVFKYKEKKYKTAEHYLNTIEPKLSKDCALKTWGQLSDTSSIETGKELYEKSKFKSGVKKMIR